MKERIRIDSLYYSTERDMPVKGGVLYEGYKAILRGDKEQGKKIITEFLTRIYDMPSHSHEQTTKGYVDKIRKDMGLAVNNHRGMEIIDIVRQATEELFEEIIYPLFLSIQTGGYSPNGGAPISIRKDNGRLLLGDGKNRVSILSAMGHEYLPENWIWD